MTRFVQVAAAVIIDATGRRVLLSQRHPDSHQGNKWEFPGGKCEPGESFSQALIRELGEELAIIPTDYHPLLKLIYRYPEKTVVLSVWTVNKFTGTPQGREGQPIRWAEIATLDPHLFPAANRMIIQALSLPEQCLVTPQAEVSKTSVFLTRVESALTRGIRMLQLRSHDLPRDSYLALAESVAALCSRYDAHLLLNIPLEWWRDGMASGLHLPAWRLKQLRDKPDIKGWLSASCHSLVELEQAQQLGVDFVFVSPVRVTASHAEGTPLGWQELERILSVAQVPVYALGGMTQSDLQIAKYLGAYGIAGITAFWNR